MSASYSDGKNPNPIVSAAKSPYQDKNYELNRRKQELDESFEDEIDSFEGILSDFKYI